MHDRINVEYLRRAQSVVLPWRSAECHPKDAENDDGRRWSTHSYKITIIQVATGFLMARVIDKARFLYGKILALLAMFITNKAKKAASEAAK